MFIYPPGSFRHRYAALSLLTVLLATLTAVAPAETFSYTGTLSSAEDTALINLTLTTDGSVTLQTFGFGGGTNAAGNTIAAGGFDSFVGLFSGTGADAVFLNGTSDILTDFSPGCPPAGTLAVGSVSGQCGDVDLQFSGLAAGTYTVLLSDGAYLPAAVFEDSPAYLGDGFIDLTGGVFQTCYDENNCNNDTANWALDVTTGSATVPPAVPEPPSLELFSLALTLSAVWIWSRKIRAILSRSASSWSQADRSH
jgi:hypothetical protein